ncbi:MAG TPA: hypothetical protein VFI00_10695, partial [Kribbella sp.]|nr:hypothetical protein [Kribbella sp.]
NTFTDTLRTCASDRKRPRARRAGGFRRSTRLGWSEPFYRNFVATEHAAEAVAITARAADDVQLRGLLKQCLAVTGRLSIAGCGREVELPVDGLHG